MANNKNEVKFSGVVMVQVTAHVEGTYICDDAGVVKETRLHCEFEPKITDAVTYTGPNVGAARKHVGDAMVLKALQDAMRAQEGKLPHGTDTREEIVTRDGYDNNITTLN